MYTTLTFLPNWPIGYLLVKAHILYGCKKCTHVSASE